MGPEWAGRFFVRMYWKAAPMQAGLALVGSVSGVVAWLGGSGTAWLAGALLLGSVVPWTLLVIKDVNDRLLAPDLDPAAPEIAGLLRRWGRLHAIRTGASLLAFACFAAG